MNNSEKFGLVPEVKGELEISQGNVKILREQIDALDKERINLQKLLSNSNLSASEISEIEQKVFKIKRRMASLLEDEDLVIKALEKNKNSQNQGPWTDVYAKN